jgi:hypothetical protein
VRRFNASYIIPVLCFGYLAFFGKVIGILQKQGIGHDIEVVEPTNAKQYFNKKRYLLLFNSRTIKFRFDGSFLSIYF